MFYKTFKDDVWDLTVRYNRKELIVTRSIHFESVTETVALKACLRNSFKQLGLAEIVRKKIIKKAMEAL